MHAATPNANTTIPFIHQALAAVRMMFGAALLLVPIGGCQQVKQSKSDAAYLTVPTRPHEQAKQAKDFNALGLEELAKGDAAAAEELFRQALAADVDYAPAHNNLGKLYLKRHDLYQAAWEFEYAINLLPDRPEPLINMGLVYETAGQLQRALGYYEAAYELEPNNAACIGCLARLVVKLEEDPQRVHWLLQQVVMHEKRAAWVYWAQELLATRYRLEDGREFSETDDPGSSELLRLVPDHGLSDPILPNPGPSPAEDTLPLPFPMGESEQQGGLQLVEPFHLGLAPETPVGLHDLPGIPRLPTNAFPESPVVPASYEQTGTSTGELP